MLVHSPILLGISPDNLLFARLNMPIFFKFPTSIGIGPVRLFRDKLRSIDKEERPMTFGGIKPLRLLSSSSNTSSFSNLPRDEGIGP